MPANLQSLSLRCAARIAVVALAALGTGAAAQQVAIGTSNPGSIYHSSGTVIAKLLNEKANVKATIQPFASPNVFIPSVNAGEMQLGLANIAELRAVGVMYPLRSAIFVRKDSPIKSLAELKGKSAVDGFSSQKIILPLLDAMYATVGMTRGDMRAVQVPNV